MSEKSLIETLLDSYLIHRNATIKQAMYDMSKVGNKELFVVDEGNQLYGAISDGDVRKWILKEGSLDERVDWICNKNPKSVTEGYLVDDVKKLMTDDKIESVPVINDNREVKDILVWDTVFTGNTSKLKEKVDAPVVIMAGGKGSRLDPFTQILPKPLIPIDEKPIINIIIDKFREHAVEHFYISINHKSKMIKSYFEELSPSYKITYLEEESPLGTAGALKFLENKVKGPFIVTNCDVIVDSDYSELIKFHQEHKNDLTLVVSCRHYVIPYGVCEIESGGELKRIKEKPEYDLLVNTGMYVMDETILKHIPLNQCFDITDLIAVAKAKDCRIGVFPINEKSWTDIGAWEEYHKAIKGFGMKS